LALTDDDKSKIKHFLFEDFWTTSSDADIREFVGDVMDNGYTHKPYNEMPDAEILEDLVNTLQPSSMADLEESLFNKVDFAPDRAKNLAETGWKIYNG